MNENEPLLIVESLKVYFRVKESIWRSFSKKTEKRFVKAVDGISFDLQKGETLALVGESGCGKTTVGRTIIGLNHPTKGKVFFDGKEIDSLSFSEMRPLRRRMQFLFQDPFSSLNSRMTVFQTLQRSMIINGTCPHNQMKEKAIELMHLVGLSEEQLVRFPHEFSGGQRQRICIARNLAVDPELLIADEPTSALDVSIQSQILNLLLSLKNKLGLTMIFISHDLSVVNYISDRIAVMYLGRIVEMGNTKEILKDPKHPYTRALLEAVPQKKHGQAVRKVKLRGSIASPINTPSGCSLHPRCPFAMEHCKIDVPLLRFVGNRKIACHLDFSVDSINILL